MRVVLQRCTSSCVRVDGEKVGSIDKGLLLLVGFNSLSDKDNISYMVNKIVNLRIFDDEEGVMNKSLLDINGSVLSISQFTLYADTKKGRRPSYIEALNGKDANMLYDSFNCEFRKYGIKLGAGRFGCDMKISLEADGPVTIILEK